MNCLNNMFWSPKDSQLIHIWC